LLNLTLEDQSFKLLLLAHWLVGDPVQEHEAFLSDAVVYLVFGYYTALLFALVFLGYLVADALDRKGEHEGRAYAWLGHEVDFAVILPDNSLADAEAKTYPTDVFLNLVFKSCKKFEKVSLILLLDTLASVLNFAVHLVGVPVVFDLGDDAALKGELERIRNEVDGQLHQPLVVSVHILREVILEFKLAVNLLEVRFKLHHLYNVVESVSYVEQLYFFVELSQLDLGPVD
jgi:hypothetical protein